MNSEQKTINGTIETIAFGGNGILKKEGFPVTFIPFTAPGDEVEAVIEKEKSSFSEGKLKSVSKPSSIRQEPRCPYFGRCGGCQLQHIAEDKQPSIKQTMLEDSLRRIGKLGDLPSIEFESASTTWGYRRQIKLKIQLIDDKPQAFYVPYNYEGHVVPKECPIFMDEETTLLQDIQSWVGSLEGEKVDGTIQLIKNGKGALIANLAFDQSPKNVKDKIADLLNLSIIAGVMLDDQEWGDTNCQFTIDDLIFNYTPRAFVQNHPEQSEKIYRAILEIAKKLEVKKALDLYSGIGVTSLLLAREGIKVKAVEGNPIGVEKALFNAMDNQIEGASFFQGDVADFIEPLCKSRPDLVLVNPPRTGIQPRALKALTFRKISRILYISCHPPTLSRDLAKLKESGFNIKSVKGYDMFPQTTHLETVVLLERS